MLTGTALDLTPFGSILKAAGWIYWLLAAGALWWAWRSASTARSRVLWVLGVGMTFGALPLVASLKDAPSADQKAMTLFAERCKTAGVSIKRTVENVNGVVWMKWREPFSNVGNFAEQFKLNDPYGRECGAESCISQLLRVTKGSNLNPEELERNKVGYDFVESVDPSDGQRYRYIAALSHSWSSDAVERYRRETGKDVPAFSYRAKLVREPIDAFSASYGILWSDLSTTQDRQHWIAGGSIQIIDLKTNEVIAERVGYMIDRGQGSQAGGRSPWIFAQDTACPALVDAEGNRTRAGFALRFALQVLRRPRSE